MKPVTIAAVVLLMGAAAPPPPSAPPREIAAGVFLLPGGFPPGRGPDGNTIIFRAPEGLVVVDTGRHARHSDGILAFAAAHGEPIAAIVNTHWHLDHTSGNRRVKAAFPQARVYASDAAARAIDGFLAAGLRDARAAMEAGALSDLQADEARLFFETMAQADALRADVVIARSGPMQLSGAQFDVRLARNAVTDGDVWLYHQESGVVVLGDLVTLPVPFLDTACADGWRAALDAVWATPFRIAVPGHGEPMTREEFGAYRAAFDAFIACADAEGDAGACAATWIGAMGARIEPEARERTARFATYYVSMLRANGGDSADCRG